MMYAAYFDCDVRDLLDICPWFVAEHVCVITAIDSNPEVFKTDMAELGGASEYGRAVAVPGTRLLADTDMFSGFDEIFVVQSELASPSAIGDGIYTSELVKVSNEIPEELARQFLALKAIRFASDGDGLNLISIYEADIAKVSAALIA